jgi:hypothetical protein
MSKFHPIQNYTPSADEPLLFDTNVWMLVTSPIGNYAAHRVRKYSNFLSQAIRSKAKILISSMIVSEIINTYLRQEFNIWRENGNEGKDFKRDYRNTEEYYSRVDEIVSILKTQVLPPSTKIDDRFSDFSSSSLFAYLRAIDFNDHYYLQLSKIVGFKIVTDDGDFKSPAFDAEIITGNPRLLS